MNIPKILPLWINDKEIISEESFENTNPYDESILCQVSVANDQQIESAVQFAKEAQKAWKLKNAKERATILRKTASILREQNDFLAKIETLDTGRPIRETICVDIISAADCLEYISSLIEVNSSRHIPLGQGSFAYTLNKPLGVCLGIGAWNYPLQVATWKAAPALATGNAFIFKPSEYTPISAYFLAKAFKTAGLPAGLFQVLQGDGEIGKKLVKHPGINKVSLTGSVPTGMKIYESSAKDLKKVSLELGGKSPLIIFDDCDIKGAVNASMLANFYSQGEICSNGTRVFVQKNIKNEFIQQLIAETKKIIIGDPLDHQTHMGPLIGKHHKQKVVSEIENAIAQGAKLVYGEKYDGNIIGPTIFSNCTDEMSCVQNEIFGPVMSILEFESPQEVITRANQTEFGLAGGVFTQNLSLAHKVSEQLEVGVCWINSYNLTPVEMPFGGAKKSGIGMENGHEVLKEYTRVQSIYVNTTDAYDSFL